jgi:thiamine-phosphate pyrophosphorylase
LIQLPHHPLLYLITDRQALRQATDPAGTEAWREQLALIGAAAQCGCQLIQIRENDLAARQLAEFTREAIAAGRPHGARVLVNDRLDVALAAGADGVHLRVSSLSAAEVKTLVTRQGLNNFLIGASTHSIAEAKAAEAGGADFIICGPVYETPSKLPFGLPLGLSCLAEVCRAVSLPVLAIGGMTLANFREPLQCGAAGIAAISLFSDRSSLRNKIETILNSTAQG